MNRKPVIGITSFIDGTGRYYQQRNTYADAVYDNGGIPVYLPCNRDPEVIRQYVTSTDGILIPGGPDADPTLYGEEVSPYCGEFNRENDLFDIAILKEAIAQGKPLLAICRGVQMLNIAYGGTLYQDLPTEFPGSLTHTGTLYQYDRYHKVTLTYGSKLLDIIGNSEIRTNSSHHQAVRDVAEGFRVSAVAEDGVIEAIESLTDTVIGVQWHPEMMKGDFIYTRIFNWFIETCE